MNGRSWQGPHLCQLCWSLWTVLLSASAAWGHPGHGVGGGSTSGLHYLTDPTHMLAVGVAVALLLLAIRAYRFSPRGLWRPPYQLPDRRPTTT